MNLSKERCWAEIDLSQLTANFKLIRQAAPEKQIMAVIKANAYGHGDVQVASTLAKAGVDRFAVATLTEAIHLRNHGIVQPLLILAICHPENAPLLAQYNLQQCVPTLEYAKQLSAFAAKAGVTVGIHCKVDTGMHRLGLTANHDFEKTMQEIEEICQLEALAPIGLFTHFSAADSLNPDDIEFTKQQAETLLQVQKALQQRGYTFPLVHSCNSGGLITRPEYHMDAVRPGIILYGCAPSAEVTLRGIAPILKLKAYVMMVKNIPAGSPVSYGRTFIAAKDMTVATVSVGYADGYSRLLSNTGVTDIHGKPAPVLGRVCMDQIIVDVTDIPNVQMGDVVTLYGGKSGDSVEEAAAKTGTISYETLCNINRRVPRVYIKNGKQTNFVDYLED